VRPGYLVAAGAGAVHGEAVLIRREVAADIAAVRAVTAAAFARPEAGGPEVTEVRLLDELRGSKAWRPELSLVAVADDGEVVGHVLGTRAHVAELPVIAIGPVSVRPGRQRAGVGSAMMHTVLGATDALGEPMAVLLGDPGYYRRFGFRLCSACQITPPRAGWEPYLQVRELSGYRAGMTGTFRFAEPFDRT
jgi:putative acetyltransferase